MFPVFALGGTKNVILVVSVGTTAVQAFPSRIPLYVCTRAWTGISHAKRVAIRIAYILFRALNKIYAVGRE